MRFDIDCHNSKTLTAIPELPIPIIGKTSLDFSNKNLAILPNTTLKGYSGVRELHLSNNQLSALTVDQLPENLTDLDIRGNRFQTLSESVVQYLNRSSSLRIKLSENPWICSCPKYYLVKFVAESDQVIDKNNTFCSDRALGPMENLSKPDLCGVPFSFASPIFITGINVVLIGIIIITFLNKKRILMWLFKKGWWIPTDPKEDANFKYDAFVAFSHKDLTTAEKLVLDLESTSHKFKLCYYNRDWRIGEYIPNLIMESIEESQRTIILLTANFIESPWSRLEFHTAIKACSMKSRKRLIVIVYPDADINKLEKGLRKYLKYNIYLNRDHPEFWTRLLFEMPHNRTPREQVVHNVIGINPDQINETVNNPAPIEPVYADIELGRLEDAQEQTDDDI